MATAPFTQQSQQLPNAAAPVLTSPVGFYTTTKKVTVTNTDTAAIPVTIYKVPSGGSADDTTLLVDAKNVPPNTINGGVLELYEVENQTLNPGDALWAFAGTAAKVNLNISGIQQTV